MPVAQEARLSHGSDGSEKPQSVTLLHIRKGTQRPSVGAPCAASAFVEGFVEPLAGSPGNSWLAIEVEALRNAHGRHTDIEGNAVLHEGVDAHIFRQWQIDDQFVGGRHYPATGERKTTVDKNRQRQGGFTVRRGGTKDFSRRTGGMESRSITTLQNIVGVLVANA